MAEGKRRRCGGSSNNLPSVIDGGVCGACCASGGSSGCSSEVHVPTGFFVFTDDGADSSGVRAVAEEVVLIAS
jgi:hypothetical protein